MKKINVIVLGITAVFLLLLIGCQTTEPPEEPASSQLPDETPVEGVAPPPGFADWDAILAEAQGQTVNFYMWGGSDLINSWVTEYVAETVQSRYGITLNMVPVADSPEYVNKVLGEQQAGRDEDGSVDLVWVNGENYRTMRQAELLYGPFSQYLPNSVYVNWGDPSVANDFGLSVDGYESPYGKAQFVMIYDSAKVPNPPTTIRDLLAWIEANPGRFTYPAPPDFTGSAFVRHVCYDAAGGYEALLGEFDQSLFDATLPPCWEALNQVEPFLWREGQTYPESHTRHQELFANGEVYFDMAYNPAEASSLVENGRYPETTRTFVFDNGTIANTHYVAIPYNSPNKAAAMVVANFLLSPEAQLSKADPANWGDLPVLDPALLSAEDQARFEALPRGVATLSTEALAANRLPELQAAWLPAIEQAWETAVLQR